MKHQVTRFLFLVLLASLITLSSRVGSAELVVHRSLDQRELTLGVARLVFTMRLLRWPDGTRVRVFVLPDSHPLHRAFAKQSLDLYPRQLRRVWDRHLFSGSGAVPVSVSTVDEMLKRVGETPGAIGYLPDGVANDSVRVIHVK